MPVHPAAGKPARASDLVDVDALVAAYYETKPDAENPAQRVSFGTSGHRGTAVNGSFNEDHIIAITRAIAEYPCAQRARFQERAPCAGSRGCGSAGRCWQWIHADARVVTRRVGAQSGPSGSVGRWRGDHAVTQSTAGRRLQVQPTARGSSGHGDDELDSRASQRAVGERSSGSAAGRSGRHDLQHRESFRLRDAIRRGPRQCDRRGSHPLGET